MSTHFTELRTPARVFVVAVVVFGAAAVTYSISSLILDPVGSDWLLLAGLTVLTGSFSIKVPSVNARISVSEAFVFTAVLSFGLPVATIIVAADSLILTSWLRGPNRSPLRALFNLSAAALAIWCAGIVFTLILRGTPAASAPLDRILLPVFALALSYFTVNSWLIATAVAFERKASVFEVWRKNFAWLSLNYLAGASVALVLVTYTRDLNVAAVSVIVPLLVIIYLTFRTSWGRLEDANTHVAQLNDLYLSTIETLAMAVDAKDQITHGHIRRVQVFATELAQRLGVSDEGQRKAIAAAALLHDMGKLAIPEHILNKPGRLTGAEFERMKQHADLGADLLSSIRFPYPVVPIVRYHHENWDGTGYPSKISGADIPLGARILSVVDCFDALTSDRPYRPRLTTAEAFEILRERRGTMYDPLVVDTFIRSYPEIGPLATRAGQEARTIFAADSEQRVDTDVSRPLRRIRENASEAALLRACTLEMASKSDMIDAFETAAHCLRQLIPATVYALFEFDSQSDSLICRFMVGDHNRLIYGLNIPLGQRVTGWAGANRRTAMNSDASLDLAQICTAFQPPLLSAMSTALADGDRLIGVMTAYSLQTEAFTDGHRYLFEHLCASLSDRISALQSSKSTHLLSFPKKKT